MEQTFKVVLLLLLINDYKKQSINKLSFERLIIIMKQSPELARYLLCSHDSLIFSP